MKHSQKSLITRVEREIKKYHLVERGETIFIALSGGADSVCLFDLLYKLKDKLEIKLKTCHYNHKLRGAESDEDELFVKKISSKRGIECLAGESSPILRLKSEDEAREARYQFFEKILAGEGGEAKIALAHNANDLAETVLLRLVRGSGLSGLRAIPRQRRNFIRPLLSFERFEIERYLIQENLSFRQDKSNFDIRFARNFLRLKVLPLLLKLNPNLIALLGQTARIVEEDYEFIKTAAESEFKEILLSSSTKRIILDQRQWQSLPLALRREVLRIAIKKMGGLADITGKQLFEVMEILSRGVGKKFKLLPHSLRLELIAGKIKFEKESNEDKSN